MDPDDYDYPSVTHEGTTYYILEPGHDYTIKERGENIGYEFDFDAPVYHPMLVDGVIRNVEFNQDGSIKSMTAAGTSLSALQIENTLRGYIKLDKVVVDQNHYPDVLIIPKLHYKPWFCLSYENVFGIIISGNKAV